MIFKCTEQFNVKSGGIADKISSLQSTNQKESHLLSLEINTSDLGFYFALMIDNFDPGQDDDYVTNQHSPLIIIKVKIKSMHTAFVFS